MSRHKDRRNADVDQRDFSHVTEFSGRAALTQRGDQVVAVSTDDPPIILDPGEQSPDCEQDCDDAEA